MRQNGSGLGGLGVFPHFRSAEEAEARRPGPGSRAGKRARCQIEDLAQSCRPGNRGVGITKSLPS